MSTTVKWVGLALLGAGLAAAQPRPVNAGSYILPGRPNSNIAQGSMFILYGQGIGPQNLVSAAAFPLQTSLGGTSVRVTVGGTTVNAIMIYSVAFQVAAVLPSNTPTGDGTINVNFNNRTIGPLPIRVVSSTFGTFARNSGGSGPGIVQNFISPTQLPTNSLIEAAQPGQTLIIWGTGLGPVSGDEAAGPLPGDLNIPVEVYVGIKPANVSYKGRSGCCTGVDQVNFTVPEGVEGCYVPVTVRAGGVTSNITTIAVNSTGKVCSDPAGLSATDLAKVQSNPNVTVAAVSLTRFQVKLNYPGLGNAAGTLDNGEGHFQRYSPLDLLASYRGSLGGLPGVPSTGCTVSQYRFKSLFDSLVPDSNDPVPSLGLDAGAALNFTGPLGAQRVQRQGSQQSGFEYSGDFLAGSFTGTLPGLPPSSPLFLNPGTYTLDNGTGSADVGSFRTSLAIPSNAVTWLNQDSITNIPRSQDLQITWSGGDPNAYVAIFGSSADPQSSAGTAFVCAERASAGRFTVPSWILASLPASGQSPEGALVGSLALATALTQPTRFTVTGIDAGFFTWGLVQVKNVVFQ